MNLKSTKYPITNAKVNQQGFTIKGSRTRSGHGSIGWKPTAPDDTLAEGLKVGMRGNYSNGKNPSFRPG